MFFTGKKLRQAKQLMRQGDLSGACGIVDGKNFANSRGGRRIARQLTGRLVERAGRLSFNGDLEAAWRDLSDALNIAPQDCRDRVSSETSKLVERTIDHAQAALLAKQPGVACCSMQLLADRGIEDRRADDLKRVCQLLLEARDWSAAGRINEAIRSLCKAQKLQPELIFLNDQIEQLRHQSGQLMELTNRLRLAINQSAWGGAKSVSEQILEIAPQNQIALDARRRCETKQAHQQKSVFDVPESSTGDTQVSGALDSTCGGYPKPSQPPMRNKPMVVAEDVVDEASAMRSFMLWIDGVGGFLVCTKSQVTLGRAVPHCGIDIPVQADLRRHHLKIKRVENRYLGRQPGLASEDSKSEETWDLLANDQCLDLGHGVHLKFMQTHPLGNSARLELTSRHRTEPWSDAILLMGDALLLGADRSNHVCCPGWQKNLVIYRKGTKILLRAEGSLEVNGSTQVGDVLLQDGIRVIGSEFSISCEEVRGFL